MNARSLLGPVLVIVLAAGAPPVVGQQSAPLDLTRAGLPAEGSAKARLSAALVHRHPQYLDLPAGRGAVRSFVVFPARADQAPVLVITANNQGMSDWLRAVGDDAAAQGFIAVVPDLQPGVAAAAREALTGAAIAMPASNGTGAAVRFHFDPGGGRIDVTIGRPEPRTVSLPLTDHAWHNALALLGHLQVATPRQAGRGATAAPVVAGGMRSKRPDLPANFLMAAKTVAESPRRGEWIDIPMAAGKALHTWISYPQTSERAPVVLVFQPGPGMDMGEPPARGKGANWLRGIADQLALEGMIAVVPDLTSGLGPGGGNFDSFEYPDDAAAAIGRLPHGEVLQRIRVARDYAVKLPLADGRLGAIGFCMGGGLAWEAAAEIEGVHASVVFYGPPPEEATMARIKAPVAAYFGANDLGLAPRIAPAAAAMKRLGKPFDVHVYEEATHVFLYRQDLGRNMQATADAWPRAVAFFKQHLMNATRTPAR